MSDIAQTSLGDLLGERQDGVLRFRAVPYAAPPVGPRRFASPVPPPAWQGVRDARSHGPIAPQPPSRLRVAMGEFSAREQSEDCLTLVIATPAANEAHRPVVVWLHGGAWLSGAGSFDWYDGGAMAHAGGVVVVGVNYRLGPLGFLHHPGIADGMMGLRDIVVGLRFLREHVAAFGGDPGNITLMGQSAGGGAIWRLLIMDETSGLFHRAIVQSGNLRRGLAASEATARARRLMQLLEIDPDAADAAERLRAAPVAALVSLQMQIARENARFGEIKPAFPPVFDDFADVAQFSPASQRLPPSAAIEAYRRRRPGGDLRDLLADLGTHSRFLFPQLALAVQLARAMRFGDMVGVVGDLAGARWRVMAAYRCKLPGAAKCGKSRMRSMR